MDRATAYEAMGEFEVALAAYEDAVQREEEYPQLQTQAWLMFPVLVAERRLSGYYDRADEMLTAYKDRLTFPVDFFRWNSASALISSEKGQHDVAQAAARAALEGASKTDSGFRYHRSIGLVGGGDADLLKQITKLAALS